MPQDEWEPGTDRRPPKDWRRAIPVAGETVHPPEPTRLEAGEVGARIRGVHDAAQDWNRIAVQRERQQWHPKEL
jgi:hypothetical protein